MDLKSTRGSIIPVILLATLFIGYLMAGAGDLGQEQLVREQFVFAVQQALNQAVQQVDPSATTPQGQAVLAVEPQQAEQTFVSALESAAGFSGYGGWGSDVSFYPAAGNKDFSGTVQLNNFTVYNPPDAPPQDLAGAAVLPATAPDGQQVGRPSIYVSFSQVPLQFIMPLAGLQNPNLTVHLLVGANMAGMPGQGVGTGGYGASWGENATPATMQAGQTYTVYVSVTNTGTQTWVPGGNNPFHLSYHWVNSAGQTVTWDGLRTSLPGNIPPGDTAFLGAQVQAPSAPGTYSLEWDMVEESVTWFSQEGVPEETFTVQVG
ncbi:MAG: hypothetical protein M0Z27_07990 [Thermaerobacter sp.]|nr:hypothetical protein [Thermaerobacter sp.]